MGSLGSKDWTRDSLADAVMAKFDFDLALLWEHLRSTRSLPSQLGKSWNPITGNDGALAHLSQHASMQLSQKGRTIRKPCKACGVARVVLGCLFAIEGPDLSHSLTFGRELAKAINEIVKIHGRLNAAGRRYESTQMEAFRKFVESQQLELSEQFQRKRYKKEKDRRSSKEALEKNLARLAELNADPEAVGVWSIKKLGAVNMSIGFVLRQIRCAIEDVLVDLRGLLDINVWRPWRGGETKVVTLVEKTLREEGFLWKEIADLVEEDTSREAIDRVRARVEGRSGKSGQRAL